MIYSSNIRSKSIFDKPPLVSIVIPSFNASSTISRTLNSIIDQQYKNMEVIIIDDGSTDNTIEAINRKVGNDPRFIVISQENKGVSSARNRGVQEAKGNYIAFLDADDVLFESAIEKRMMVFQEEDEPDLLGVFCPAVIIDENESVLFNFLAFNNRIPNARLYFSCSPECGFNPSSVIIKRDVLIKSRGFDISLPPAEDYELWHRLMRNGGFFRRINDAFIGWTQHKASATHSQRKKHFKQCTKVSDIIFGPDKSSIPEFSKGMGTAIQLLNRTRRALSMSIMSFFSGNEKEAVSYFQDMQKIFIEQIHYTDLYGFIKTNILRCRCLKAEDWTDKIYPDIKYEINRFLNLLDEGIGYNTYSIKLVRQILWGCSDENLHNKIGASRFPIDEGKMKQSQSISVRDALPKPFLSGKKKVDSNDHDLIELLDLSLMEDDQDLAQQIYSFAASLSIPLGWHYILDLLWTLKKVKRLKKNSLIIDAGAGQGVLQYILARHGFKVISVDFAPRTAPSFWKTVLVEDSTDKNHVYLNFLLEHYHKGHPKELSDRTKLNQGEMKKLLLQDDDAIVFYRSDLKALRLIDDMSIDCIVSISALEHNTGCDAELIVKELDRVLKPGGFMAVTISASMTDDWYHEQSKGWCWCEETLRSVFNLPVETKSNFSDKESIFNRIKRKSNELHLKLDPVYSRSGNNGMPWGKWDPKYLPVGIYRQKPLA